MYSLNPRLAADVFDGEYIIANLDTGLYYSVQGLAVSVLNHMPFPDLDKVIQAIAVAFPSRYDEIKQDLHEIMKELLAEGIVKQDADMNTANEHEYSAPVEYIQSRFNRYADMQDLLLLDPIHDVDEEGWVAKKENNQMHTH